MFKRWIDIPAEKSCLIVGPRRCGKTTLLKNRFPEFKYATLDDLDHLEWAKKDPKGFVGSLGKAAIIDEIQRLPQLTIAVKFAIDNQGARFLMTGSSTLGLLDATADTLAGRIHLIALPTACWGEDSGSADHSIFAKVPTRPDIRIAFRELPTALRFGQFPEVLVQGNDEEKKAVLVNYRNTYFTRDLMQLSNIENIDGLLAVFHHLARSIGSHLEVSNFAREAGISYPTAKKYLNALSQAQLTFKLYGWQFGPAKRFTKAAKMYFADNGIISSLNIGLSDGQVMENFVVAELEKRRKLGFIPADRFYYYKSAAGLKIDLVYESQGEVTAIEIKGSRQVGPRDLRGLKQFSDSQDRPVKRYLFYMGEDFKEVDGIHFIPIAALYRGS